LDNYRLLLPGDIEADRERTLAQFWGAELGSDWLLAGHHGSKTSTTPTFLKRVRPQIPPSSAAGTPTVSIIPTPAW
jgi:competence protein ComEC